ncbi:membrane transport protein [Clostridium estertheticum]|uniref:Membrane transport protein n=1 Tax=Clostridium estertheticum TaxID=238834 RepID=A0AA47I5J8_9CLOT|nr:SLC13 family permease [Clostridium estertheticum]MBU3154970.1 membrane transport protein [Clostridium estertheticum]MBU3200335.1 membrane transport protein [Clostridium estertheticum]WAG58790.1 membrane transport protein [Clostridium estertheticum]WAG67168.1 membrane transport protein [Clostridium estertheticum]
MTIPMIIALVITVGMVILIMIDKLPFGAPPILACLLMVIFGVTNIKTAFGGFSNATIIMLASFMAIVAALEKTNLIGAFRRIVLNMANKGGFKAYIMLFIIVMLASSIFGTGSTAFYILTLGILSTIQYTDKLPRGKVIAAAGFACNHPLIPINVTLQYGIVIAVLEAAGSTVIKVNLVKFSIVNLILSLAYIAWALIGYKVLPNKNVDDTENGDGKAAQEIVYDLPKWKEYTTYAAFLAAVVGMILQSKIGDAAYMIPGLSAALVLVINVLNFDEIRNNIGAPIILMSAGVIGVADALGSTGLTALVGKTVASMLGTNVNAFVLIFVFCMLTSLLATLTGSTIGTVYVFAPMAISTCMSLGLNPTAAAAAIVLSGWNGHFLPIDGLPAMVMGIGKYKLTEFWKYTIPMYFIRLIALTVASVLIFPL